MQGSSTVASVGSNFHDVDLDTVSRQSRQTMIQQLLSCDRLGGKIDWDFLPEDSIETIDAARAESAGVRVSKDIVPVFVRKFHIVCA
jgi:hypothetical protein